MKATIALLALLVVSIGYFTNNAYAEVSENQAFLLEGSGFAVTEDEIKTSEIDIGLSSQDRRGSSINFVTEDGFVTLGEDDFIISELEGKFLRDGRYIRLNGNIESSSGPETSISFFGRLIDESKDASVYGFTGRITTNDETYKIIYTTKLTTLSKIDQVTESVTANDNALRILKFASTQGIDENKVPGQQTTGTKLAFFSEDRISIEPGTTITIVNDDTVSHSILSGKENYGDRYNPFTPDIEYLGVQRISTGPLEPGESVTITFEDAGFYRLYDPDYPWMKIVAYVFPNTEQTIFGEGQNLGN
ncbi:hypothetical protein [Nitrosopumilus sp.]|uniref:cupredoxin domain-containing protein n=1 Tax=Nitrosopumilus sp. TaxID=2024843 RepID=UPI002606740F|nr:hypothetical protein [Nitrosopumilus sp.]